MSVWESIFDECHPAKPATTQEIEALLADISRPLTTAEITEILETQERPFLERDGVYAGYRTLHPTQWVLPSRKPPDSYLEFLRFSNGGSFRTGKKWFDPFLTVNELRKYMLAYHVPEHLPGALPFAFDGSGTFYLFDMRNEASNGEYPVLLSAAGNLGFEDALTVGGTFRAACSE